MMTKEDFIKKFPMFLTQHRNLVPELLSEGQLRLMHKDSRIYTEGDVCSAIAFILSGEVRVYKIGETGREITLYEIGPGDTCILNASCILGHTSYPANAIAISDVEVLLVPSAAFQRIIVGYEEMRDFIFTLLSQRLASVMELIEEVAFGRMDERLMEYLVEKSTNNSLETTHQKIANDLGTSREVVSRLLKDFERKRQVRLSRNSITLIDN